MDIRPGSQQSLEWLIAIEEAEIYIYDGDIERLISYKWDVMKKYVIGIGLF